jgi:cbb3-type cytochrome c oxidase subunit II
MRIYERFGGIVGLAFFFCYFFAFGLLVLFHTLSTVADEPKVRDVNGNVVDVPPYTPAQARGRDTYIQQVCWHCHSQFVRPVNQEDRRFGPVSQAGEGAIDRPHLYGTRRIGPDLAREGGLRTDDWQLAHLWNPRATVSASVMPAFTWLFRENRNAAEVEALLAAHDYDGNGVISDLDNIIRQRPTETDAEGRDTLALRLKGADQRGLPASKVQQDATGNDLKPGPDGKRLYVDAWTQVADGDGLPGEEGDGQVSDRDGGPLPTRETLELLDYLQRLGTAIGPWRQPLAAPTPVRSVLDKPPMKGVTVTWKDSAGKEQTASVPDGRMPLRARERRLHGDALRLADDATRSAAKDLEAEYEALMGAWRKANPEWDKRLAEGKVLFQEHCASCHGDLGRGNGLAAPFLLPRPRDFTQSAYRYRSTQAGTLPLDGDLYRTLWRGLPGSSMPPWHQLGDKNLWLLVDYVQHFLETIDGDAKEFDVQSAALALPPVPKVTAEQLDGLVRRGKAVFAAGKCSNCHGTEGRSDGAGWRSRMDDGATMRPRDLKPRFAGDQPALRLRGGVYPQDLYRTIFTGLGGTPMASSLGDFKAGWDAAAKADRLAAAGAPAAEVEQARKDARRQLIVPLFDDDLVAHHGVTREPGPKTPDGQETTLEFLDRLRVTTKDQVGDDWALVFYVMDLLGARNLIPVAASE